MSANNRKVGNTKILKNIILVLAIVFFAILILSFSSKSNFNVVKADDFIGTPTLRYLNEGGDSGNLSDYTPVAATTDLVAIVHPSKLFVFLSDYDDSKSYSYIYSTRSLSNNELNSIGTSEFISITGNNEKDDTSFANIIFVPDNHSLTNDFECYYYFRCTYQKTVEGVTQNVTLFYQNQIHIKVIANEVQIGFHSVKAEVESGGQSSEYKGEWLSRELKFTIVTEDMYIRGGNSDTSYAAFSNANEKLYYSIESDPEKRNSRWIQSSNNVIRIENLSLVNSNIYFRVTNAYGDNVAYYNYGENPGENKVNMDPVRPEFEIRATTKNLSGADVQYEFRNNNYAWSDVVITLNNTSNCVSSVSYEYLENNVRRPLSGNRLTINSTKTNLIFYAKNQAGVEVASTTRSIFIDKETPTIQIFGYHRDPKDATATVENVELQKRTEPGFINFGYANESVSIQIYNRDLNGNPVNNTSNVKYQYQEMNTVTQQYSGSWNDLTNYKIVENSTERYYYVNSTIRETVSLTKKYKFRLLSGAGLTSEEIEVQVIILRGVFSFELLSATPNKVTLDGWTSDFVLVTTAMPTDSKSVNGVYSTPTTQYTFYYSATDNTFPLTSAQSTLGSFYEESDGVVYFTYTFKLIASANSAFNIYAENAAGRESANTEKTEQLKIDVVDPEAELTAYIQPVSSYLQPEDIIYLDVENPDWVNGSITLKLEVKRGVSGIYVRQMQYSRDAQGNILVDALTGEYIWQEGTSNLINDEVRIDSNGEYYIYYIYITKEDPSVSMEVREYRFRIHTGSGIYIDKSFTAKLDTTDTITLNQVNFNSDGKEITISNTGTSAIYNLSEEDYKYYICKETIVKYSSSLIKAGNGDHFSSYYTLFDGEDVVDVLAYADGLNYTKVDENIRLEVPQNAKGIIYFAIYLESDAKNYLGEKNKSGKYVFEIQFNTLDLTISYSLTVTSSDGTRDLSEDMENNIWVSGEVSIDVEILINNDGSKKVDENYKFYYMLINNNEIDRISIIIEDETRWLLAEGAIIGEKYSFTLHFINQSFYGKIAISVCNEAGYRNKQEAASSKNIMIDNTSPQMDNSIIFDNPAEGHIQGTRPTTSSDSMRTIDVTIESTTVQLKKWTYYSSTEIYYERLNSNQASTISYYYYFIGSSLDGLTTDIKVLGDANGFIELTDDRLALFNYARTKEGVSFDSTKKNEYYTYYFALYAVNSVGNEGVNIFLDRLEKGASLSNSLTKEVKITGIYEFVYDSSVLNGTGNFGDATVDPVSKLTEFAYLEQAMFTLTTRADNDKAPNEYIKYQFSADMYSSSYWFDYLEGGTVKWYKNNESATLAFTADTFADYEVKISEDTTIRPFENGVSGAFTFRAINRAGTYYLYTKIIIKIDKTTPVFEIKTKTKTGATYTGGDETSISNSSSAVWTNGPITIEIEYTKTPQCGVNTVYTLEYLDNGSATTTNEMKIPGLRFTTDMLSGFNRNRDAILRIRSYNNSDSSIYTETAIRLSVDQVVPVFNMSGKAFNNDSDTEIDFTSGGWTSKSQVSISKSKVNTNVSPVVYTYTYRDATTSSVEELPWGDEEGAKLVYQSCVLTVTARSSAGLEHTIEFVVNIDTVPPVIKWDTINVIDGQNYYIDLRVYVEEANIKICEYITIKGDTRGFSFDPTGYILSTSSVDNSTRYDYNGNEYRGYVEVYVEDYAGNTAKYHVNILPFNLTVSNVTLSDEDLAQIDLYESMLQQASGYITSSRKAYFENLISRLRDRVNTLKVEIAAYQDYLEKIANRTSFELKSDYAEMFSYYETYTDYEKYGTQWIQTAITGDATSKYYSYFQNFLVEFNRLDALMKIVEKVQDDAIKLPAINMVEREDYEEILKVRDEYFNLNLDQRTCFDTNLYNKIMDLKTACEALLLTDKSSGVKIDGDVAEGATISVDVISSTSDTFKNAQELLANTNNVQTDPSYVVSIYRISLDGAYSQTVTGDLTVTLPIPESYQGYIYFAVYSLSDDGSMKLINGSQVSKNGETIVFDTEALSTYVLCTRADVKKTVTTEGEYGTILGIPITTKMIRYALYVVAALFGVVLLVVIIMGIRHRRFLNSYNKAYRHSLYRKGVKGVPKGNKK